MEWGSGGKEAESTGRDTTRVCLEARYKRITFLSLAWSTPRRVAAPAQAPYS